MPGVAARTRRALVLSLSLWKGELLLQKPISEAELGEHVHVEKVPLEDWPASSWDFRSVLETTAYY